MSETAGTTSLSEEYLNEYSGDFLTGISIAFAALTTLVLALRFYAQRFNGASLGLDDVFIVAAYVVNLGMCAIGIVAVQVGGVGQHVEAVEARNPALLTGWAKSILAFELVYFTSVALPKIAILLLYLRIFNWRGTMRTLALLLLGIVAATGLSLVLAACFQCRPLPYWWDRTIPGGRCFDVQLFFHAQAIPGFLLDFFIMGLPVGTIWALKLPTYKRVALLMIFLVASLGVVASIIRAVTFFGTAAFTDRTWASVELAGWSIIETGSYIITACLPHLRPLFSHYTPQWLKSMVKRTVTGASHSLSNTRSRLNRSGRVRLQDGPPDLVELKPSGQHSYANKAKVERHASSLSYGGSQTSEVEVIKTAELMGGEAWKRERDEAWGKRRNSKGQIVVTTEVTLERHDSTRKKDERSFMDV